MFADPSDRADVAWTVRRRNRWRTSGWRRRLDEDLQALGELFGAASVPVFLVGGLGLSVRAGEARRNHADIDLAVMTHHLSALVGYLAQRGFEPAEALGAVAVSPWHRLDRTRSLRDQQLTEHLEAPLRIRRRSANLRLSRSRVDLMDLLPITHTGDTIVLHGYDTEVPAARFFPCAPALGHTRVLLPNPAYKQALPARWPRQMRDLRAAGL